MTFIFPQKKRKGGRESLHVLFLEIKEGGRRRKEEEGDGKPLGEPCKRNSALSYR